jgi:hypothetical protein
LATVESERAEDEGRLDAAPGLARIAAAAWVRTASWAGANTLRAGRRLTRVALGQESATELIRDARNELVDGAQRLLGASGLDSHLDGGAGSADARARRMVTLRDRGTALLERSSELGEDGDDHPAYARILTELSPDEARILRLLAVEGPQAAVDIRTWRPLDVGSAVVAPGLTMIARHAGLMHTDRLPAYLSNLYRLGLIWFSRESLSEPEPYQVLEAQPDVVEAVREAGRARIVRRSIHLTPFGGHFCKVALPLDTVEIEALPAIE